MSGTKVTAEKFKRWRENAKLGGQEGLQGADNQLRW